MFGSKPRNSGFWNFHNPDSSFLLFARWPQKQQCCSFWMLPLIQALSFSLKHPYICTWVNGEKKCIYTNTYIHTSITHKHKTWLCRHVRLQTDRHLDPHALVEHCVRLLSSSPKFLMTLLWSYWNDLSTVTHTQVMREWLYLAEPDRALRLWYKRLPYCLTSSVNRHTHAHPFSASYKLATRWHINERGFVKYLWACKFESTIFFHPACIFWIIFSFTHQAYVKAHLLRSPRVQSDSKHGGWWGNIIFGKYKFSWGLMGSHCAFFLIFCHVIMLQCWMLTLHTGKV